MIIHRGSCGYNVCGNSLYIDGVGPHTNGVGKFCLPRLINELMQVTGGGGHKKCEVIYGIELQINETIQHTHCHTNLRFCISFDPFQLGHVYY